MMRPPRLPRDDSAYDQYRIPHPRKVTDIPSYLKKIVVSFIKRMGYILKLVWEASPAVLFVTLFMSVFNGIMPVVGSFIGKDILNTLAKAYSKELTEFRIVLVLLVLQALYLLLNSVVNRIGNMITRIASELVENHIKMKIMLKAKEVDLASFDDPSFYSKMENANREAGHGPIDALNATFSIVSSMISIISFIIVIASVNIIPAFLIIVVAIPSTLINFIYRKKNFKYLFSRSTDRRQLNYYADVIVNKDMVKEIKMMGLTDVFVDKYRRVFKKYFNGLRKLIVNECLWNIGATLLTTLVNCILFIWIAKGVFTGNYEVGNYSLYTGALNSIALGISTLITTTATIYESTLFINNMIAFMDEKPTIVTPAKGSRSVERGKPHEFIFEDVSFRYRGTTRDVISHLNLTINRGDTVVVVGLNGSGKSTLIKLMTRLYDPTEGRILLDGHDLKEYNVKELYDMFGLVFQDFGKYAVSVKDNIAFGEITKCCLQADIEKAARESSSEEFINRLPDRYETELTRYFNDHGIELSIGQWQKLSIARAFFSDSDVLILDEPTASLDPLAEQEIFNQFEHLRSGKTTVFVSHRLSSASVANKIVVLKDGKVAECGSHSELMSANGEYKKLFQLQADRYIHI